VVYFKALIQSTGYMSQTPTPKDKQTMKERLTPFVIAIGLILIGSLVYAAGRKNMLRERIDQLRGFTKKAR